MGWKLHWLLLRLCKCDTLQALLVRCQFWMQTELCTFLVLFYTSTLNLWFATRNFLFFSSNISNIEFTEFTNPLICWVWCFWSLYNGVFNHLKIKESCWRLMNCANGISCPTLNWQLTRSPSCWLTQGCATHNTKYYNLRKYLCNFFCAGEWSMSLLAAQIGILSRLA